MSVGFARDEAGVALPLAIMVMVIVGVMGAGLLVFVRSDLEAVVEVNRGQRAADIAEAGVQAAKRQLLSDANRRHYDLELSNDCTGGDRRVIAEDWSPLTTVYSDPADCTSGTVTRSEGGISRNFAGGRFNVTIQCLRQPGDDADECAGVEEVAPENVEATERAFFKIISTGYYPADGSGAVRRVEAVYHTVDLGVPRAYFTPSNITLRGTADITGVSLFSLGNVEINGGAQVRGEDRAYGDWANEPYNATARPTNAAGIGAVGRITGSDKMGTRDFHGDLSKPTTPRFVENPSSPQGSGEITFPFEHESQLGQQDGVQIEFLREEAIRQGNYIEYASSGNKTLSTWPANSTSSTVVFVRFPDSPSSSTLTWSVGKSCNDPPVRGTLVITNGDFKMGQHTTPLQGTVIVRGGLYQDGDSDDAGGNTCLDGFVNASGNITIRGSVQPLASEEALYRPGFYGVELWSWRELYQ